MVQYLSQLKLYTKDTENFKTNRNLPRHRLPWLQIVRCRKCRNVSRPKASESPKLGPDSIRIRFARPAGPSSTSCWRRARPAPSVSAIVSRPIEVGWCEAMFRVPFYPGKWKWNRNRIVFVSSSREILQGLEGKLKYSRKNYKMKSQINSDHDTFYFLYWRKLFIKCD